LLIGAFRLQTAKRYTHATDPRKMRAVEALASYSEQSGQKMVKTEEGAA